MKKMVLIISMFLLCAGVVSASSVNGEYNGNPIVIVKSQGKALESDEVPAMIYDGHTVVPISLLRQLGVSVNWDGNTYSVDISLPQNTSANNNLSEIAQKAKKYDVTFVQRYSDGAGIDTISYRYAYALDQLSQKPDQFRGILSISLSTDAITTEIIDSGKNVFSVSNAAVRDFTTGRISSDELIKQYKFEMSQQNQQTQPLQSYPSNNSSPSPTQNNVAEPQNSSPTTAPPQANEVPSQTANNAAICQQIKEDYTLKMLKFDRNNNPYSGGTQYQKDLLTREYQRSLESLGCQQ